MENKIFKYCFIEYDVNDANYISGLANVNEEEEAIFRKVLGVIRKLGKGLEYFPGEYNFKELYDDFYEVDENWDKVFTDEKFLLKYGLSMAEMETFMDIFGFLDIDFGDPHSVTDAKVLEVTAVEYLL